MSSLVRTKPVNTSALDVMKRWSNAFWIDQRNQLRRSNGPRSNLQHPQSLRFLQLSQRQCRQKHRRILRKHSRSNNQLRVPLRHRLHSHNSQHNLRSPKHRQSRLLCRSRSPNSLRNPNLRKHRHRLLCRSPNSLQSRKRRQCQRQSRLCLRSLSFQ
jgi:hypothetical protein